MKIVMNKPAFEKMTADIIAGCKRAGEVADAIGRAADSVTKATAGTAAPRRGTSWQAASAWADLLGRFTGR